MIPDFLGISEIHAAHFDSATITMLLMQEVPARIDADVDKAIFMDRVPSEADASS